MAHLKVVVAVTLLATVWQYVDGQGHHGGHGHGGHGGHGQGGHGGHGQGGHGGQGHGGHGHAHSFAHFHGPVVGPAQAVKVGHAHGHGHAVDYVAHPKYDFAYGVTDHKTGDSHAQKESRDGHKVVGEYTLKEPGGNIRTVKYVADKDGFHAHVINSNGNDHSGAHHGHHH